MESGTLLPNHSRVEEVLISSLFRTSLSRHTSKTDVRSVLLFLRSCRTHNWPRVCLSVVCHADVASTSPSNSRGFVSSSVSSTNSSMMDYEVEVVEIRVREGELNDIIP